MKKTLLLVVLFAYSVTFTKAQNTWLKTFGTDDGEKINVVETDTDGNVYLAGRMNKDLYFGDSIVKKVGSASASVDNYFLVKLDKDGGFKWGHTFMPPSNEDIVDLAIDKSLNVYLALREPSYYYKFDSAGNLLFEKRLNALNGKIGSIEIDNEGYTWLGCSYLNKQLFKLDNLPAIPIDNNSLMFLAKLDANGTAVMLVPFASNSTTSRISRIAVRDSFVYAIGNTQFDIVVGLDTLFDCDMVVAKFNTSGEYKWAKGITGTKQGFESLNKIAISKNHQVVLMGRYDDPIFIENITLPNKQERELMFLISYDKDGNLLWAKNSTTYFTPGVDIEFTSDNTIALAANYAFTFAYEGMTVGDGTSSDRYTALVEIDANGTPLWMKTLGQENWADVKSFTVDKEGNWFITGSYFFNNTAVIDGKSVDALGGEDLYVIKNFTVAKPSVVSKTFCEGEPVKELSATGAKIKWYSDSALTNLVFEGATFNVTANTTTSYYVIQKAGGAISQAAKVTATILPATNVTLQTTFPVLTANPQNGKNYKWYADGVEISGATSATYTPTKSGDYHAVLIDSNDCNNYSDTVSYVYTSINEMEKNIAVYPNPATHEVSISGLPLDEIKSVSLYTTTGQLLKEEANFSGMLSLEGVANGVYVINVQTSKNQFIKRLVIQH